MKYCGLVILGLILTMSLNAQTLSEKIALKTCECLDTLNTIKQIEDSLRTCTSRAMAQVMVASTHEEKSILSTVEGIKGVFQEVNDLIPSYCYNVRRIIIEEKNNQSTAIIIIVPQSIFFKFPLFFNPSKFIVSFIVLFLLFNLLKILKLPKLIFPFLNIKTKTTNIIMKNKKPPPFLSRGESIIKANIINGNFLKNFSSIITS